MAGRALESRSNLYVQMTVFPETLVNRASICSALFAPRHRSFEHEVHAELGRHVAEIARLAFEGERRARRSHRQAVDHGKAALNLVCEPVGEFFATRRRVQIFEWKYGHYGDLSRWGANAPVHGQATGKHDRRGRSPIDQSAARDSMCGVPKSSAERSGALMTPFG
jgi:hypothetical protein